MIGVDYCRSIKDFKNNSYWVLRVIPATEFRKNTNNEKIGKFFKLFSFPSGNYGFIK